MESFKQFIMPDIRDNNLTKNILFARLEYASNVILNLGNGVSTVPELVTTSNPMRGSQRYYLTYVQKQADDKGLERIESIGSKFKTLVIIDGDRIKFNYQIVVERYLEILEHSTFSLFAQIGEKSYLIDIPKEQLLSNKSSENSNYIYFPLEGSLPITAVKMTQIQTDSQSVQICSDILDQRIDQTNERLMLILWQRVLSQKLTPSVARLGIRIINAIGGLRSLIVTLSNKRPLKNIDSIIESDVEIELIEGFTNALQGIDQLSYLVSKNIGRLVKDPTKSFMLHFFAFVSNEQITEKMESTNSVFGLRDFKKKDYFMMVFGNIKDSVFQKVSSGQPLSQDMQDCIMDIMIGWISVKGSGSGRFWKGRLMRDFFNNVVMAFYLAESEKGEKITPEQLEEALIVCRDIMMDMQRFLKQRLALSGAYAKL